MQKDFENLNKYLDDLESRTNVSVIVFFSQVDEESHLLPGSPADCFRTNNSKY